MRKAPLSSLIVSAQAGIACGEREDSGIEQLRLNNILTNGQLDLSSQIKIPAAFVPEDMLLQRGDVLFNNTNSVELVGKTACFEGHREKVTFSNHITRLRTKTDQLDPRYLALWLQHQWRMKVFERMCDRWIGQAAVQRSKLESLLVPVPEIHEQRRISDRLTAAIADVEIASEAAQMQSKEIALLRRRLLDRIFDSVKDSPRLALGEYARTSSGTTPPRGNKLYWSPAEIPWVKTGEVAFAPITRTEEAVSQLALAECSLTMLPPNTVLVAMYGQGKTRGQSAILAMPATTNQACFAILPNDTWEPEFLFYWLMARYQDLRSLSEDRGGNQANLNGALLNAHQIPAPSRDQQLSLVHRITAALREVHVAESAVQVQRSELDRLPRCLFAAGFES